MTANITILTAKKEDVLTIPQRSVIKKDGSSLVLVPDGKNKQKETKIEIGLMGSDGNVEVVGGLSEGNKIINPSSVSKK